MQKHNISELLNSSLKTPRSLLLCSLLLLQEVPDEMSIASEMNFSVQPWGGGQI